MFGGVRGNPIAEGGRPGQVVVRQHGQLVHGVWQAVDVPEVVWLDDLLADVGESLPGQEVAAVRPGRGERGGGARPAPDESPGR